MEVLTKHVKTREHRLVIERLFGVICYHDKAILNEDSESIYGIHTNCTVPSYDSYINDLSKNTNLDKLVKLSFGR